LVAASDLMRRVAALAAVAALLAAYLLFVDRAEDRRGASTPGSRAPLLAGFDRASVRRLSIARGTGAPFSLERQAGGADPPWRVLPGDRPAGAAVEELLTALDIAEIARTADTTPTAAGLSPATVTLTIDGGGTRTLRFGHADAGGGGAFVAIGDEATVRVAPRHLLDLVDRPAEAYRASESVRAPAGSPDRPEPDAAPSGSRDRPLLDFAHFDVRRLIRTDTDGTVELVSDDGESWRSTTPSAFTPKGRSIDAANATRVASALANLRPERFLVAAAVRAPTLRLEVEVVPPGRTAPTRHRLAIEIDGRKGCIGRLDETTVFAPSLATCDELALPLRARGAGD
jgi:hypothetical protein